MQIENLGEYQQTLAVADHNIPTEKRNEGISDPISALQINTLVMNCKDFNVPYIPMDDIRQGIVHVSWS